jgi:hypothetical protein
MSDAYKCDRCGRYGDGDAKRERLVGGDVRYDVLQEGDGVTAKSFDLCERCEHIVARTIAGELSIGGDELKEE